MIVTSTIFCYFGIGTSVEFGELHHVDKILAN